MLAYPKSIRQGWACGYELPPAPNVPVMAWSGLGYSGPQPTICPGYTTSLPETIECARAWKWWSKGQLAAFVDSAPVTDAVKLGIEICETSMASFDRWRMTPANKGGGLEP